MLSYNQIKPKTIIVYQGDPYLVLESDIAKRTKQKPVNQTKLKNLKTGSVIAESFHQKDMVEEADVEKRELRFEYQKRDEVWFTKPTNPSVRIELNAGDLTHELLYIKEGDIITALYFDEEIIGIEIPIKVKLKVTMAPPNIKGNTAQGGTKRVTLETGLSVDTPLFIETGDIIEINTETGSYATRVEKA